MLTTKQSSEQLARAFRVWLARQEEKHGKIDSKVLAAKLAVTTQYAWGIIKGQYEFTHARLGYLRLENPEVVEEIEAIYKDMKEGEEWTSVEQTKLAAQQPATSSVAAVAQPSQTPLEAKPELA